MTLRNYFKNLSTFRVLFLLLLLLSAVACIVEHVRGGREAGGDPEREEKAIETLLQSAEQFGSYLGSLESLAVSLATRFELIDKTPGREQKISQLLEDMLESSPESVDGLGISLIGEGESRVLALLSKRTPERGGGIAITPELQSDDASPSVREINMERRIAWKLLSSPLANGSSRFSSLLSVSIGRGVDAHEGDAIVVGDMDWLRDMLARLQQYSPDHALCVTPGRDFLWFDNGVVNFDKDFSGGHFPDSSLLSHARAYLASGETDENNVFLKADIMGTGWALLLPKSNVFTRSSSFATETLPLACIIVAVIALLLEGVFASIGEKGNAAVPADVSSVLHSGESSPKMHGHPLLAGAYSLLFKYRITNPEQARIDSELKVARDIQFSLVPEKFPPYSEWREFDLYSLLSPAREVGGDYYDFFMADPNRLVITVGDVSGKGVPAALYMAVSRTAFRTLARSAADPGQLLTNLNEMLVRDNQSGLYVTIVCWFVDLPTGKCEYAIAGHPAPLWNKASDGRADFVDTPRETIIGMQPGLVFPVGHMRLRKGDTLLLYSDGVSEARNEAGDELEYGGLRKLFLEAVAAERCQTLIEDLECSIRRHMGESEQNDDITLVAFRYWGPGGQKLPQRTRGKTSVKMVFGGSDRIGMEES